MGGSSVRREVPWSLIIPWALVLLIEILPLPGFFLLVFAIPLIEAIFWLWAVVATARRIPAGWRRRATTGVLLLVAVWFTNWAAFHPVSYFAVHRPQFAYIGKHHPLPTTDDDSPGTLHPGTRLPWWTADLSTTGRGETQGSDVVVLPQYVGLREGSTGFVHVKPGADPEGVDMTGNPRLLTQCKPLADGWYFC